MIFAKVDDDDEEAEELCWAKLSGCRDERRGLGTTTDVSAIWFELGVAGDGEEDEVPVVADPDADWMGEVEMSAGAAGCCACNVSIASKLSESGDSANVRAVGSILTGGGGGVQV